MLLSIQQKASAEEKTFVFSEFRPYEYMKNGEAEGINVRIIQKVCSKMGITPVFKELPWIRALEYVKSGKSDAVFSLFKTEERESTYNFTHHPLNNVKMRLFSNKEIDLKINSIFDIKGLTVGVYRGSSYGIGFDNCECFKKDPANSNRQIVYKQFKGRTDLFIMDETVADYWIKIMDFSDHIKPLNYSLASQDTFIAFNKSTDIDINKFSELLAAEKKISNQVIEEKPVNY